MYHASPNLTSTLGGIKRSNSICRPGSFYDLASSPSSLIVTSPTPTPPPHPPYPPQPDGVVWSGQILHFAPTEVGRKHHLKRSTSVVTELRSQISGRLDALHSVLANHGARLLEGAGCRAVCPAGGVGRVWATEDSRSKSK